jgi:superfamily II DNA or RNA helicase
VTPQQSLFAWAQADAAPDVLDRTAVTAGSSVSHPVLPRKKPPVPPDQEKCGVVERQEPRSQDPAVSAEPLFGEETTAGTDGGVGTGARSKSESPLPPTLRPYQADAIAAVEREHETRRSTLLVLPTGTGKTVVFAELVRRAIARGGRALVLAHREELLDQAANKLREVGVIASIEQADRRATLATGCVVASVQSLQRKRLERFARDAFDLVIPDEAHHAPAKTYRNVLDHFATAKILGVTATADRCDGKALGEIFESVAFSYDMRQAIRDGWLVPIRARRVLVGDLDLSSIRSHHGDFDQGQLAQVLADEKILHAVVPPLLELAGTRKTLVFGVDVAHAHALAAMLNRYRPACAIAVDGSASTAERNAALALWRRGQFQFLVNCALFTEGFDEPECACVAMARPTQSRALYTQMLGRGGRLLGRTFADSIAQGKRDMLALDFVGNSRHRLVGPADALAAGIDDGTREQVERLLEQGADVESALAEAELLAARKREQVALLALALYREKEVDPFIGDQMPPPDPSAPWARDPATDKQLAALDARGISDVPPGLTKGDAGRMLDALTERHRLGLATVPQCRLLAKLKLDTRAVTKARFGQIMAIVKRRGTYSASAYLDLPESLIGGGKPTKPGASW